MRLRISMLLAMGLLVLCLPGCSDEDGRGSVDPQPSSSLYVIPDSASVEVGESVRVEALACGVCSLGVTWYVNHISGGNSEVGTITQTNPAAYTAPDWMPYPATVSIMAVLDEDQSVAGGCDVAITHNRVYVDVSTGNDATGSGSARNPVKTVTRGVEIVRPGATVSIASGLYSDVRGETFPIVLSDGVSLVGEDRDRVTLTFETWPDTLPDTLPTFVRITGSDCSVRRLGVGHGGGTAIHVTATAEQARIESVSTHGWYAVLVDGAKDTIVRDCRIVSSPKCPCGDGIKMVGGDEGTAIRGCRIEGFHWAVYVDSSSNVLVEDCEIRGNHNAVYLCHNDDPQGGPDPDLGGGARGSAGRNDFRYAWGCLLKNLTTNTIFARNNTWSAYPPVEGTDFCNPNGGQVIW